MECVQRTTVVQYFDTTGLRGLDLGAQEPAEVIVKTIRHLGRLLLFPKFRIPHRGKALQNSGTTHYSTRPFVNH